LKDHEEKFKLMKECSKKYKTDMKQIIKEKDQELAKKNPSLVNAVISKLKSLF